MAFLDDVGCLHCREPPLTSKNILEDLPTPLSTFGFHSPPPNCEITSPSKK